MRSCPPSIVALTLPAHVQLRRAAARALARGSPPRARRPGARTSPAASSARRTTTRRASAGCSSARRATAMLSRPSSSAVDETVEQLGLLAQQLARCAARSPRPPGAPRAAPPPARGARARARTRRPRCSRPRARPGRALDSRRPSAARVTPNSGRTAYPRARASPAAPAAPARRRGGRGSSRPGRSPCARSPRARICSSRPAASHRRLVAHARAPTPAGCPARARPRSRCTTSSSTPSARTAPRSGARPRRLLSAQPVVDVQRLTFCAPRSADVDDPAGRRSRARPRASRRPCLAPRRSMPSPAHLRSLQLASRTCSTASRLLTAAARGEEQLGRAR